MENQPMVTRKKNFNWKITSVILAVLLVAAITSTGIFVKQGYDNGQEVNKVEKELEVAKNEIAKLEVVNQEKDSEEIAINNNTPDVSQVVQITDAGFINKVTNELKSAFPDKNVKGLFSIDYYEGSWRVSADAGDHSALFYKMSNDTAWKFFTGTQGVLSCKAFNTSDVKKAFGSEMCSDDNGSFTNVHMYNR